MHYKILGILLIFVLTGITLLGLNSDTRIKKISIHSQNFEVRNENASVQNSNVDIVIDKTGISHRDVNYSDKKVSLNSKNTDFANNSVNFKNTGGMNNSNADFNNKNISGQKVKQQSKKDRYIYENISWNEWKSNFINQVLEDMEYIPTLNNYGIGSWFYYSFDVMADGTIRNMKIFSFYLNNHDRLEIMKLIKRYEHQQIVKFPQNSKRKKAKIDAVVVLSTEETKSSPEDFHDHERVKIKY